MGLLFGLVLAFLSVLVLLVFLGACAYICGLAIAYLLGPGFLYLSHKISLEPEIKLLPMQEFPRPAQPAVQECVRSLREQGFEVGSSLWLRHSSDAHLYIVMTQHPATRDRALVTSVLPDSAGTRISTTHVEFRTDLADGRCVRTLNSPLLSAFGAAPRTIETFLPALSNLRELHWVHRSLCHSEGQGQSQSQIGSHAQSRIAGATQQAAGQVLDLGSDAGSDASDQAEALKYLEQVLAEERLHLRERGLICVDEASGVARLTYQGACAMSWGSLWPVSSVRRARMKSAADLRLEQAARLGRPGSMRPRGPI